jgi:carboxypeptidase family protein
MSRRRNWIWLVLLCLVVMVPVASAQNISAQLAGTITDPTGAVIPGAEVTLTALDTGVVTKLTSSPDGLYSFFNLQAGHYEMKVSNKGFRDYVQRGIRIQLNEKVRIDVKLELGAESQTIEVIENASALNYETAEQSAGISPDTVNELPLIITAGSGGLRSAASFITLLPGVTAPTGEVIDAHINGGPRYAGEFLINGVSGLNPSGGNGTYSAAFDFGQSPEMVSELKVITANYEPQYGSTGGSIFVMETRAGTNDFHGNAFWYHRNDVFNARQWNVDERPRDLEHDFGGSIGGPVKIPGAWSSKNKTYFFFNFEGFRQKGGATRSILSIPSLQERQGDFRDWKDADGNLIPIYDPATTRAKDPTQPLSADNVTRDQFMGCDGRTPNVICPNRIQNSLAQAWFKYLPQPSYSGPLNNFIALDVPTTYYAHTNHFTIRADEYLGDKDHIFVTVYHRNAAPTTSSEMPKEISNNNRVYKRPWVDRVNWDHTFSPVLLNHFAAGYNDDYYNGGSQAAPYVDLFPQIPGASRYAYPPSLHFGDGFQAFKDDTRGTAEANKWPAPSLLFNDLLTWVKGKHTFKMGGEYRTSANTFVFERNEAGTFNFDRGQTGLLDVNSGSPIASFLLEQVDNASVDWRPYGLTSARFQDYIVHFGDTWKVTPKLSLNLGIRWELHPPAHEQDDVFSFLDPNGANPGAGGRPGRLVFAGSRWGDVSYGKRYPENLYKKAFSPRLGIAYALNPKTVIRTGYGIFYDAAITPGWQGGIGSAGFNLTESFGNSLGGLAPALLLSEGLPTDYAKPPFLNPAFNNGQSFDNRIAVYRHLTAIVCHTRSNGI